VTSTSVLVLDKLLGFISLELNYVLINLVSKTGWC